MAFHPLTSAALAEREAAVYIGYTAHALKLWRREGRGPAFIRHGRSIRYLARDLDAWLAAHRVETRETRTARA